MFAIAALGVLTVVAGVLGGGLVMLSRHDLVGLAAVGGAAALVAGVAAAILAGRIATGVAGVRSAGQRLANGDLSARVVEEGPEELRDVARAFNEMAEGLTRVFETRRNLIAWASHDLRAPLASLQAMIEALEDRLAAPEQYLPAMRAQVGALSRLVDDLFELSRIETGTLSLAMAEVPLEQLAAECVDSLRPVAEQRGVRIELAESDGHATALCDPTQLDRVFRNLITNALRHTPDDGTVVVRIAHASQLVQVDVEDTGPGLPEGAAERVFESFWRADPSRSAETGGAGLGLAIARGIIQAHGGEIWAENRPEGGARFAFTVPQT